LAIRKKKCKNLQKSIKHKFNLTLVDQFEIIGTKRYGTACPVECVEKNVHNENFIVVNGDDLYSAEDLKIMRALKNKYCYVAGYHHQEPQHYGLHKVDQHGFLQNITEKPKPGIDFDDQRPLDYSINIGMYKFTPEIFESIKKLTSHPEVNMKSLTQ